MSAYYRHKQFGHIVRADPDQPKSPDIFAGVVVQCDDDEIIEIGTHSTCWMRAGFDVTTRVDTRAIDTFESMQQELDTLRAALGVDAQPAATLAARTLAAAAAYRRLYDKVREWQNEQ